MQNSSKENVSLPQDSLSKDTWNKIMLWVSGNHSLIRKIASPYYMYIAGDREDLYQEATLAAYKTEIIIRKKNAPEKFVQFFRVIFRTDCIKMASGLQTVHCLEDYFLPLQEETIPTKEPKKKDISQALEAVSKRQKEVCLWLLQQPTPVSTPDIAKEFNVSRRHACRLVSNSVQRIAEASL
jgi:RNA polymerase sigma factor (sigma-70 family)